MKKVFYNGIFKKVTNQQVPRLRLTRRLCDRGDWPDLLLHHAWYVPAVVSRDSHGCSCDFRYIIIPDA